MTYRPHLYLPLFALLCVLAVACGPPTQTIDYTDTSWQLPFSKDSIHSRLSSNTDFNFQNITSEGTSFPSPPMLTDTIVLQMINVQPPYDGCMGGFSASIIFKENFDESQTVLRLTSMAIRCPDAARDEIDPEALRRLFETHVIDYIQADADPS